MSQNKSKTTHNLFKQFQSKIRNNMKEKQREIVNFLNVFLIIKLLKEPIIIYTYFYS